MRFSYPLVLLLLLVLPAIAWSGWPGRGARHFRERVALVLRLAMLLCLLLALAGLEIVRTVDRLAVVFLVDASDSMPAEAQATAAGYVQQAIATMRPDDQASVILFGEDALVERSMSSSRELEVFTSTPRTSQTDLAAAIRLGMALFPPEAARRMVILSDGADTTNAPAALQATVQLASASGVQVQAVPFAVDPGPEALVSVVEAPGRLRQGERFDLRLVVEATASTPAGVRVLSGGQVVYQVEHTLQRGTQTFSLPLTAGEPGFTTYTVQIDPQPDGYYQNNAAAAFSQIEGPPRLLLVAPPVGETVEPGGEVRPDEAAALLQVFQAANFEVQRVQPGGLSSELVDLAQFAALVLVDIPARDLTQRQMLGIQSYVRDLGGGLLVVGGPTSYGVGGYYRTPLEETLPVEMQIKDPLRRPSMTMVFIIDRSGSMSETSGGVTKLELAKEAAIRSVELLFPTDRAGVIAFDDSAAWVVPVGDLSNPQRVQGAIGSIRPGGGTDILAGLQAMAAELPQDPAGSKHVILLTDGGADPAGIPELVERLYQEAGITLTTVGVGRAAAAFLPDLAELGGGRYHFAADPATIPRIFTEETSLVSRAYLVEREFTPQRVNPSPILAGIASVPRLLGYVGTSPRSTAQTVLVSDLGDPILATWQYGLGKAVAFTSDASGRWGRQWVQWDGFPTFWAQAVSYITGERSASPLTIRVDQQAQSARLVVDAQTEAGEYLNNYALQANLVGPDGDVEALALQQVAPGRYVAPFIPGAPGAYLIHVSGQPTPAGEPVVAVAGWVQSYSAEYRLALPQAVRTEITGTAPLSLADPAQAFAHNLPAGRAAQPAWPWLLALAAFLLPLDVAARRLVVSRDDIRRGFARQTGRIKTAVRVPWSTSAESQLPATSARLQALKRAKQRAAPADVENPDPPPPTPAPPERTGATSEASGRAAQTTTGQAEAPISPESEQEPSSPSTTAANLLAAKRARKKRH